MSEHRCSRLSLAEFFYRQNVAARSRYDPAPWRYRHCPRCVVRCLNQQLVIPSLQLKHSLVISIFTQQLHPLFDRCLSIVAPWTITNFKTPTVSFTKGCFPVYVQQYFFCFVCVWNNVFDRLRTSPSSSLVLTIFRVSVSVFSYTVQEMSLRSTLHCSVKHAKLWIGSFWRLKFAF